MYSAPSITSRLPRTSRRGDKCAGTSKFSYSSEILEKHWEPETEEGERLAEESCRLPAQNLTEIPPRTERPVGQTSSTVSPLLVFDWKSSRLRASMTA